LATVRYLHNGSLTPCRTALELGPEALKQQEPDESADTLAKHEELASSAGQFLGQ
jgi:hypothetical protein